MPSSHNRSMVQIAKCASPALRENPYLEKQARMTPAKLDLIWDDWHSQAEKSSISRYDSSNPRFAPLEQSPTYQLPFKSSAQVGTGKRWGIFKARSKPTKNSLNVGRDTGMRENQDKTMFVDRKAGTNKHMMKPRNKTQQKTPDATGAPYMQPLPPIPLSTTPITPQKRTVMPHRLEREHCESRGSAMYFTVDPNWDASKGEAADLLPMANVPTHTSTGKVPHKVTSSVAVSKPISKSKRGRSFLTFE